MPETIYVDPLGLRAQLADPEELAELMASRGEDYWNSPEGNETAELTFCPEGWTRGAPQTAELAFTMKDGLGFHFYYSVPPNRGLPTACLFSSNGEPFNEVVEVNWAGETRKVYRSLFVPLEAAQKVVRTFCETGQPSEAVLWLDCGDVPDPEEG